MLRDRALVTVVALLAGASIGAGPADPAPADAVFVAAAIDPGDGDDSGFDADLVRAIQRRLAELGLFRGPVNGQPSLALDIAVREAQRSLGLREDGLISPELLARLEGVAEKAQALRRRLDEARDRQSREARLLLAASPATADLVGAAGTASEPVPAVLAVPCTERVDVACTVGPALSAARLIDDSDRRDWILAALARALTRAGHAAEARDLVKGIVDPRTILSTLRDIVTAHGAAGDEAAAQRAADAIPDERLRLEALIDAAAALVEAGQPAAAMRLLAPVLESSASPDTGGMGTASLAEAAGVAADAGDNEAAAVLLARAEALSGSLQFEHDRDLALGQLAEAQAGIGAIGAATSTAVAIDDAWRRAPLFAVLAAAAARHRQWAQAEDLVGRITEARYRAVAEANLAALYGRAGLEAEALRKLDAAEATARALPRGFARNYALAAVAVVALDLVGPARSDALARAVPDPRLRAETLIDAAKAARGRGETGSAATLLRAAMDAAAAIRDPVERAATRARLAVADAGIEPWPEIVSDAAAIDDPWQRARALVAVAAIASQAEPDPAP